MPRKMPKLDSALSGKINKALQFTTTLELARLPTARQRNKPIHYTQIEEGYEQAFSKIFDAWEEFLEKSFLNYLFGCRSIRFGCAKLNGRPKYYKKLTDAETAMLTRIVKKMPIKDDYFLWANPRKVKSMVRRHIIGGQHEKVMDGARIQLIHYSRIRHRIAHKHQRDARAKFADTVLKMSGMRVRLTYRPGAFLRKQNKSAALNARGVTRMPLCRRAPV
jgi:hypothetical protein